MLRTTVACLVFLTAGCSTLGGSPRNGDAALQEQLMALEKESWVAWQKRDGAFFASFLAADHVDVGRGGPAGRDAIVAFVGSPACVVESYAVDRFQLTRFTPDTALLVYRAAQKTICGAMAVPSPAWTSSLYVYRDGRWQNAMYQQTQIPGPPS